MNILIRNAHVLTMDAAMTEYRGGVVAVTNGKLHYVGTPGGLPAGFTADRVIDAGGGIVMPGLVNAHTHLAMSLLRGYGSDRNLQDWLQNYMWPAEDRLQPGDCYWGSLLGIAEMLKSGTTAFLDMYFFMDETARAVEETGIRAVLSRGLTGITPSYATALPQAEALYRDFQGGADGRISVMLGPHAEYTNTEATMRQIVELGHKLGCGLHVHVQETRAETQGCVERYGISPTKWLDQMGVFSLPTVAAHCVTVDDDDIAILAERGVQVAHNPGSNMKLASGIAPVRALLRAGVGVGLGTDGPSSNNNLDMIEEARLAALCAKLHEDDPTAVSAAEALRMATMGGARALGLHTVAGSLEAGKRADLILLDPRSPALHPMHDAASAVVYAAGSADVKLTMVDGKILVENGQLPGIDLERVYTETGRIAQRLCGYSSAN